MKVIESEREEPKFSSWEVSPWPLGLRIAIEGPGWSMTLMLLPVTLALKPCGLAQRKFVGKKSSKWTFFVGENYFGGSWFLDRYMLYHVVFAFIHGSRLAHFTPALKIWRHYPYHYWYHVCLCFVPIGVHLHNISIVNISDYFDTIFVQCSF